MVTMTTTTTTMMMATMVMATMVMITGCLWTPYTISSEIIRTAAVADVDFRVDVDVDFTVDVEADVDACVCGNIVMPRLLLLPIYCA